MNDRDLHERASAIFLQARDTPAPERERFLQLAAASDERLLIEVRTLLEHDPAADAEVERASSRRVALPPGRPHESGLIG